MKINILRLMAIAVICLLGITLWYLYEFDRTTKKNIAVLMEEKKTVEKKASDLSVEKTSLQDEAMRISRERDGLVAKLSEYEHKMKESENNVRLMAAEIEKVKIQIAAKDMELQKKLDEIAGLQNEVLMYKAEVKKLNKRILQSIDAKRSAQQAAAPNPAGTTLEPITVTAEAPRTDTFMVVDVNRDYDFIVINGGSADNIKVGDSLCVFRNKELLGRVVIEKVTEDASVAKTLNKKFVTDVKKNDIVRY